MFCSKCGYELKQGETKCPFCGNEVKEKPTYGKYENPFLATGNGKSQISEEKIDEFRTMNGYVNLKTKFFHHILIAGGGYLLMNVLSIIFALIGVAIAQFMGNDFSCLYESSDFSACVLGEYELYIKISAIAQLVAELLIIGVLVLIFRKYIKHFFAQLKDKHTWKWIGIGFAIMYGINYAYSMLLTILNITIETNANQQAVNEVIFNAPLLGFLFVVVAAPLFEEFIFRFGVFRAFATGNKKSEILGMIITILVFAGVHLSATFEEALLDIENIDWALIYNDLLSFPIYLAGAFGLTFSYYKSKNLAAPIVVHMCWNFMSYLANLLV